MVSVLRTPLRVDVVVVVILAALFDPTGPTQAAPGGNTPTIQPEQSANSGMGNQGNSVVSHDLYPRAVGVVVLAAGGVLAGSVAAALIALTVFLWRRSRRIPAT